MPTNTVDRGFTAVLLGLTAATGLIDAISYLGMGHVLVANMTGNVVFLGFALAGAKGFSIAPFVVALASFVVGAALGGRLGVALGANRRRWLVTTSAIQTLLAATAAMVATTVGVGPSGTARFAAIALLGLGTGVQNATVRRLAIPDLTTTVLTMTLTGLAADSSLAVHAGTAATFVLLTAVLAAVSVGFATFTPRSVSERVPDRY
jgi:uncharacterized membrane protein YoaK (UPF0700 family)